MNDVQKRLLEMAVTITRILERNQIPYTITYGTLLGSIRHKGFIPWDDDFDLYLLDETYDKAIDILRRDLPKSLFLEDESSEPAYFHGWAHVKDLNSYATCEAFPRDGSYSHHGLSVDLYKAVRMPFKNLAQFQIDENLKYLERLHTKGYIKKAEYEEEKLKVIDSLGLKQKKFQNHSLPEDTDIFAFMSLDGDYMTLEELFPLKTYLFENIEFLGMDNPDAFLQRCYGNYMQLPPEDQRHPHYSTVKFL